MTDYVVTGIPRSGTSLLLSLLETDKNYICFSEPPWIKDIREASQSAKQLSENLKQKIINIRRDITEGNSIEMVYQQGRNSSPDNYFKRTKGKLQKTRKTHSILLDKNQSNNSFVIKANAVFTATLGDLLEGDWKIVPVVRDPLYVLMSWNSVPIASSKGKVKVVEKFSKSLAFIGQQSPLIKRQVLLLDWYFKQYDRHVDGRVLEYEKLIKNPAKTIKNFFPDSDLDLSELNSKNSNSRYHMENDMVYRKALEKYGKFCKKYYPQYG